MATAFDSKGTRLAVGDTVMRVAKVLRVNDDGSVFLSIEHRYFRVTPLQMRTSRNSWVKQPAPAMA
jgi:hypothetical protein